MARYLLGFVQAFQGEKSTNYRNRIILDTYIHILCVCIGRFHSVQAILTTGWSEQKENSNKVIIVGFLRVQFFDF